MRATLAILLALLVLAAPASAACRFQGPQPSRAETQISYAVGLRKDLGMPHGRAYVQRLERDRAAVRRGGRHLFFALTPREAAYLVDRSRIEDQAGRVEAAATRVRGLSGGVSIEDDYPRGAYVSQRLTRALRPAERRSLERRATRVRFPRVTFSERVLRRLQDRITDDEGLEALGIRWSSVGVDIDTNTVAIEYSSDRPDAEDVLRARYSPRLTLRRVPAVIVECAPADGYAIAPDGVTLTIFFGTSGSASNFRAEVREEAGRVLIDGVSDTPPIQTADLVFRSVTVTLAAPLGTREVVSITTRKPVPRRSSSQD